MREPLDQDELTTLKAELRRALQHQAAAYERIQETQREVEALMGRARALLQRLAGRGRASAARPADPAGLSGPPAPAPAHPASPTPRSDPSA